MCDPIMRRGLGVRVGEGHVHRERLVHGDRPALDAQDLARVLTGFRGQPARLTPTMRYVRSPADGESSAYVFDEDTGMVFLLD